MYNEATFSNIIYEYFVLRFKFRYYECGENLPSIDNLCQKFSVSPLTVKAALKRLQDEGYVSIRHGKCTQVTFQQSEEAYRKFKLDFFADRISLYSDFYETLNLIYFPLYLESFQRMDEEDFTYLRHITERLSPDDLVNFYCHVLQKLENPLILNLFWESSLFLGFPSPSQIESPGLYNVTPAKERIYQLIENGRKKSPKLIYDAQIAITRDFTDRYIDYLKEQIPKDAARKPLTFRWRIYRDRPQICYSLATRILHHIYLGEYCKDSFLPSYQSLAEKYEVSVSTVRRTIHLLNEIGAVCSINGKGTHILALEEQGHRPNFNNPAIRRNLAYYIHAFELLKFSIEGVSRITLPALSDQKRSELIRQLEAHQQAHRCELVSNELLVYITTYNPLKELKEIYEKLYQLMLWGFPLTRHRSEKSGIEEITNQFTKEVIISLKRGDFDNCAKLLGDLFARQYPLAEAYLLRQGMTSEELHLSPAIRLTFTEDPKL